RDRNVTGVQTCALPIFAEPGEHPGQVQTGEARHLDVQHDHIDVPAVQLAQGGRAVVGGAHLGHMGVPTQQEGELVQSRGLVIDGEDREHVPQSSHATYTPGWNLGTRRLTFDPAPTAVSTTSPYSSPNVVRSRSSTF